MKIIRFILLLPVLVCISNAQENKDSSVAKPASTDETVAMAKLREDFLTWKFGMFIHYNVATYNEKQWATGFEDPASFAPDKLDCDQWLDAAAKAGMKYAILTVKHTGGWCLWDSKFTESHDMTAFVNYKNGKGDIVREFVDSCRKHGIKKNVKSIQPRCLVIANNSKDFQDTDIWGYEYPWLKSKGQKFLPDEGDKNPAEVCNNLGKNWFWNTSAKASDESSAEEVVQMVKLCNSRRANYLLNVCPDKSGRMPDYSVERLRQIGELLSPDKP